MTYERLDAMLNAKTRNKDRVKLQNNTFAERRTFNRFDKRGIAVPGSKREAIAVKLHATDVLVFYKDGDVEFNTGGWETVTTKDRINTYAPSGYAVYSDRGAWRLYGPGLTTWEERREHSVAFQDGITISGRTGKVRREFIRSGKKLDKVRLERRRALARQRGKERRAEAKVRAGFNWLLPLGELFKTAQECGDAPPADARIAYHFVLRSSWDETTPVTQHGRIPVRVGQTLRVLADVVPCQQGLHASDLPSQAYGYCQGPMLCKVAVWGQVHEQGDKLVAQYRHVLAMVDATDLITPWRAMHYRDDSSVESFNAACIARLNETRA